MGAGVSVVEFKPTQNALDAAWEQYQFLVLETQRDSRLLADREHIEATIRAHKRFEALFNAMDAAA
jgi:hypothetical protein